MDTRSSLKRSETSDPKLTRRLKCSPSARGDWIPKLHEICSTCSN